MSNLLPRLPGLLLLMALLAACDPPAPVDPPVVTPPVVKPDTNLTLTTREVTLGRAASGAVAVPFSGQWRITDRPDWLSVTPLAGKGNLALTVTADRARATPLKADQAQLTGELKIEWSSGSGTSAQSGTVKWTVTAQQFDLSGRLIAPAQALGLDARAEATLNAAAPTGARGVIVKYRDVALKAQAGASLNVAREGQRTLVAAGLTVTGTQTLGTTSARLDVPDVEAALQLLRADPRVEYAVPNALLHAQATPVQPVVPGDQFAGLQWGYTLAGYGGVWRDMEAGGYTKPVTVAVIDSGVRFDHPDLKGQLWLPGEGALDVMPFETGNDKTPPYDSGDGDGPDTDPTDPGVEGRTTGSHGTHVTGIIVARWGDNGASCEGCSRTGVVGAAYKANVKVLPIRALDAQGVTSEAEVATAVRYAAGLPVTLNGTTYRTAHPAQVINLSLGGAISADTARPMCEAIQDARNAGALVIAAAGNGYGTSPYYPAACSAAVSVGSVTLSGGSAPVRSAFSNFYPEVQLSAPGGAEPYAGNRFNGGTLNGNPFPDVILSTDWDYVKNQPRYAAEVGTSQASPQVAALAALLLSKGLTTGPADTLARLNATATDLGAKGRDEQFGFGMINAAAALNAPAVSNVLGLRVQDARGLAFQPAVDAMGRFQAFLGDGTYTVVGGVDRDGNGIYGETQEPRAERQVTLSPSAPSVNVGDLQPR